jgi:hypothetical protein
MQEILSYSYLCAYDKSVLEVIYSEVYVVFFQKQFRLALNFSYDIFCRI